MQESKADGVLDPDEVASTSASAASDTQRKDE
jgi:hypothetical protein